MNKKFLFFLVFVLGGVFPVNAQNPCAVPDIIFNKGAYNIFDETQEMYLGDVIADSSRSDFRIISDEEANSYLRRIGERIVKHLPRTGIKFQFQVIDLPEVNAFASAGGRIYVTRKMIAFVKSEDELAGFLGHELGHATVRHTSADLSKAFKATLGITKVGDRKDIFDKYNEYLDKWRTKRWKTSQNHEDNQQLEADRIGIYAMAAAGYSPKAMAEAWDRLAETKGKTGGFFSDLFGNTEPEEKRLAELLKAVSSMPGQCRDAVPAGRNADFIKWQSYVVTTPTFFNEEKVSNLIIKKSLAPHLRGDVRYLRFSPNGSYIIAQDDTGINVIKKEPLSFLFRIDSADAKYAKFTPDSRGIVFQTNALRVEKWDIETKKAVMARDIPLTTHCFASAISPNGDYLACYSWQWNLDIVNVETSEIVFRKENFYIPTRYEYLDWRQYLRYSGAEEITSIQFEFSPNGKYMLASRVFRYSTGIDVTSRDTWFTTNSRYEPIIGFDLEAKKEIKLGGDLKEVVAMPFTFYTDDKIIGQDRFHPEKSGIFQFPGGQRAETFTLNANYYTKPGIGDQVVVRPTNKAPVGIFDIPSKKFILANKTPALDIYGDVFVSENKNGEIGLFKLNTVAQKVERLGLLELPKNNLATVEAISLSPDLSWLALSDKSRGGVWNLKTGERRVYIRGFQGAFVDNDSKVYADFPKQGNEIRTMAIMDPVAVTLEGAGPIDTRNTQQAGQFLLREKRADEEKINQKEQKEETKKQEKAKKDEGGPEVEVKAAGDKLEFVGKDATVEVYDVRTRALLWSKVYPNEVPYESFNKYGKTVIFTWLASTKTAKDAIAANPDLAARSKTLGSKAGDYYIQVLDSNNGEIKAETLIETGDGSFRAQRLSANGDWLVITDSNNRILVYSLKSGELLWRFFGNYPTINPVTGILAVENVAGQVSIYDLKNGGKIDDLVFPSELVYARFSDDGKRLFILTRNQNYYIINSEGFVAKS